MNLINKSLKAKVNLTSNDYNYGQLFITKKITIEVNLTNESLIT